jgi:hypothetical protein
MAKWRYEEDLTDLNKPVENKMGNVSTNSECIITHHIMRCISAAFLNAIL